MTPLYTIRLAARMKMNLGTTYTGKTFLRLSSFAAMTARWRTSPLGVSMVYAFASCLPNVQHTMSVCP